MDDLGWLTAHLGQKTSHKIQLLCRCGKSAARTVEIFPTQISMSNRSPGQRTTNPNKRQAGPQ